MVSFVFINEHFMWSIIPRIQTILICIHIYEIKHTHKISLIKRQLENFNNIVANYISKNRIK